MKDADFAKAIRRWFSDLFVFFEERVVSPLHET